MKLHVITPEFVDEIPRDLNPGILYVCCRYRAVKHLCACGCDVPINTPLHPTAWTLTCNGVSVSLWPSIGNWSEKCQSHYWISNNSIHWAPRWSKRKILAGRKHGDLEIDSYFRTNSNLKSVPGVKERYNSPSSVRRWLTQVREWMLYRK